MESLLQVTSQGLYCAAGEFHIDPWKPVELAVTTHAHSDHARPGSAHYLCAEEGAGVLRERLGPAARIETLQYGASVERSGVRISLHPAGHILGSAQVRVEYRGEVWVVSGDYKVEAEPTCAPFEPVRCHTFISEATFGLPIYRWRPQAEVFNSINSWWRGNQAGKRTSVLFAYSLGKAQRLLAGLDPTVGPILVHASVSKLLPHYEAAGVRLPVTAPADAERVRAAKGTALVIAPSAADHSPWMRPFGDISTGFASGWMQVRGARRWRSLDRGFTLSDHADWNGLVSAIHATGAQRVLLTHGSTGPMVRWLGENGWEAGTLNTHFHGDGTADRTDG
ncbi:MAG: ligase-associated DNA damage response exonuclease [Chthoniobacteraceae bacterium]